MVQATAAADFVSTVGINTSITMIGSAYQNYAQMTNALSYLGVTQVRDTYDNPYTTAEFALMGQQLGLRFDFFVALGSATPEWQLSQIKSNPSITSYVEGYNESDGWWQSFHGATGAAATAAVQQYLYTSVKSNPVLAGVGVIQASFASPGGFAAYGDNGAYADYANTHTYAGTGNSPSSSEAGLIAEAQQASPGRPTITTEAGYQTTPGNVHGVSELVQAKYDLDLLFEQAKLGVKLTYLWELADNYADPGATNSEDHYGLFRNDWTPKPAAVALHNTMAIMGDPGTGGVAPGSLGFSFDGLPASVQSSLYQKSDGTFELVVWNDVRLSGPTVQADVAVAPIATTLHLDRAFARIAVFDPLVGTGAVQLASGASTLDLQVLDHPVIIALSQDPAFASAGVAVEGPDRIVTNPLRAVDVDGVSVAGGAGDLVTVRLHAGTSGLSVLDTNGHLLADAAADVVLAGTVATVDAELATLTYTGGAALGSDTITVSATGGSGLLQTHSIAVSVLAGTPASNSGGPALSVPATFSGVAGASIRVPRLVVSDAYAATHEGTVTLAIHAAAGSLRVPAGIGGVSGNGTGSLGVSGSFADVTAALSSLAYTAPISGTTDMISYSVSDQQDFTSGGTTAVTVSTPAQLPSVASPEATTPVATADERVSTTSAIVAPVTPQISTGSVASVAVQQSSINDPAVSQQQSGAGQTQSPTTSSLSAASLALESSSTLAVSQNTSTISQSPTAITTPDVNAGSNAPASSNIGTTTPSVDAPTGTSGFTLIAPATLSNLVGTTTRLQPPSFSDAYAATRSEMVTLVVHADAGVLQVPTSVANVLGNGTGALGITGSVAEVTAALSALSYTAPTATSVDTISYYVSDQQGLTASQTTTVLIEAVGIAGSGASTSNTAPLPSSMAPSSSATDLNIAAVYRFFDSRTGTQFLTSSSGERDTILATRPDLISEGVGIGALTQPSGDPDAVAVYRFFDSGTGTHFYTSSSTERDAIQSTRADLKFEGSSFYEHSSQQANDVAVYRFFDSNNGTHFYTASLTERASILAARTDLIQEGVAFYAPQPL